LSLLNIARPATGNNGKAASRSNDDSVGGAGFMSPGSLICRHPKRGFAKHQNVSWILNALRWAWAIFSCCPLSACYVSTYLGRNSGRGGIHRSAISAGAVHVGMTFAKRNYCRSSPVPAGLIGTSVPHQILPPDRLGTRSRLR
jgi:hypothetical protein